MKFVMFVWVFFIVVLGSLYEVCYVCLGPIDVRFIYLLDSCDLFI
jgi:hypothetical protein